MTRRDEILKLIVEHFIKSAQPVGSQTLLDSYQLDVSSATIRNEMNALEKEGLIEKTHASSGRVPSAKGYEYYVTHLREDRFDDRVRYALQSVLEKRSQSVEEIIQQSCEILSNMTNLASVVLGPKIHEEHLVSVQVIPIGPRTATTVFVTDQGYVENKTFLVPEDISVDDVVKAVSVLNDRLKGTSIADLVPKMRAMQPAVKDYLVGQDVVYQAILGAFTRFAGERMNLYGKENLLDQPEFAEDAKKLRRVLEVLDDPKALRRAMEESLLTDPGSGINMRITSDDPELGDMAILSATVTTPGGQNTTLNLVGPSRMDYDRAVALLQYVSETLDEYFSQNSGQGESECPPKTNDTTPKA
ncbi:MAG: heat-inducible transcriptional repressor HrcA [Candidatus Enteromonas sp.]|nr:heat-inducible transcriptional repressor HrcA [Candidatus Enteromonas sp.]